MTHLRATVALFVLLFCACSEPRPDAEDLLRKIGPEALRSDAARLYKDLFASRAAEFTAVKSDRWPQSFEQFRPLQVGAYPDGISLTLMKDADAEAGLYIIPLHMELVPKSTPRATFEQLSQGVYWFSFADPPDQQPGGPGL